MDKLLPVHSIAPATGTSPTWVKSATVKRSRLFLQSPATTAATTLTTIPVFLCREQEKSTGVMQSLQLKDKGHQHQYPRRPCA